MLPIFPYPTLESCSGGVPKHTPHPVFGRCPDSTQLWGSLPASLFRRVFPSFLSPPIRISLTGLHMLQATLQLSFSVSGRESPTVGPGHSPQLNTSHLGGITPTLPISLREFFWVFLSFGKIWLYCKLMRYSAIIYRLLDESIAPLVSGKIFHP